MAEAIKTFGTNLEVKCEKGQKMYIEDLFLYKMNSGFDRLKNVFDDVQEPSIGTKYMKEEVTLNTSDMILEHFKKISIANGLGKFSNDELDEKNIAPYFYDVIYERNHEVDNKGWDGKEYTKYLQSLLNYDFDSATSKEDLNNILIPNSISSSKDYLVIVKFAILNNFGGKW